MTNDQIITVIANIINGIGLFFVVLSMAFKKKQHIILSQAFNQFFSGIAYFMLKGYAGLMLCIVTLIMDIFIFFDKQTKKTSIIFAFLTFFLGTLGVFISIKSTHDVLNGTIEQNELYKTLIIESIFSFMPVLGTSAYNIVSLKKDSNIMVLRISFLISCALWAMFSLHIKSYVGFVFNLCAILVNIVRSFTIKKEDEQKSNENNQETIDA